MKKYTMETVVGVFVVVGLVFVGYLTVKIGDVSLFGHDSYKLYARFSTVSGLREGSSVEMLGIEVGKVGSLSVDQETLMAKVELQLDNGIKVYDDARATIKTSGLIGDKFISLDPGGAGEELKPGDSITETTAPTDIEELISKYVFGDVKKGAKKDEENQ